MPRSYDRVPRNLATTNSHFLFRLLSPMENASFVGEGRTGATSDSPARNGIRRSATPRRRTAPPLRTTGCLNEPESTLPVLAFRLSSPKSARAQVHITANLVHQIQAGSTSPSTFAVRLEEYLRPLGAPNFREAQLPVAAASPDRTRLARTGWKPAPGGEPSPDAERRIGTPRRRPSNSRARRPCRTRVSSARRPCRCPCRPG